VRRPNSLAQLDMYPTVLDIAGVTMKHQPVIDGISLLPLFEGKMRSRAKPLGFSHGHYASKEDPTICEFNNAAWIDGRHMLRLAPPTRQWKAESVTLFDIQADPAQKNNIADQHPQDMERMHKELAAWRESVKISFAGKNYLRSSHEKIHSSQRARLVGVRTDFGPCRSREAEHHRHPLR